MVESRDLFILHLDWPAVVALRSVSELGKKSASVADLARVTGMVGSTRVTPEVAAGTVLLVSKTYFPLRVIVRFVLELDADVAVVRVPVAILIVPPDTVCTIQAKPLR